MQIGMKRPAGRPKSTQPLRTNRVCTLLTDEEAHAVNQYTKRNTLDRAAFIRNLILEAIK